MVGALIGVRAIPRDEILNKVILEKDIDDDQEEPDNKKPKSKRSKMIWLNFRKSGLTNIQELI